MKHNLAEINAALRLGDRFVPPVGAVLVSDPIIFSSTLYPEAVLRVVAGPSSDIADMFWVNVLGNNRKECVSITEPLTGWATYVLQSVDILEILSVPSGVPPFAEWPRGGEEMKHDLEAINAALRLGDEAWAPIGSVFLLLRWLSGS